MIVIGVMASASVPVDVIAMANDYTTRGMWRTEWNTLQSVLASIIDSRNILQWMAVVISLYQSVFENPGTLDCRADATKCLVITWFLYVCAKCPDEISELPSYAYLPYAAFLSNIRASTSVVIAPGFEGVDDAKMKGIAFIKDILKSAGANTDLVNVGAVMPRYAEAFQIGRKCNLQIKFDKVSKNVFDGFKNTAEAELQELGITRT